MLAFIALAVLGFTAVEPYGSRSRRDQQTLQQDPWTFDGPLNDFSADYAPQFKTALLDDDVQQDSAPEDSYSLAKVKQEVINIQENLWCFLFGMCYYTDNRFEALVSDTWYTASKPLDYCIAVKELLEERYGTRFSHPIIGQSEEFDLREGLLKRFKDALYTIGDQWNQIHQLPNGDTIGEILNRHPLYKIWAIYFLIMDKKSMESAVEKIENVRERFYVKNSANDFMPQASLNHRSGDENLKTPPTYRTSVNVTGSIEKIQLYVNRLFGYIFNAKPSLSKEFVTLGKMGSLTIKEAALVEAFVEVLEELYHDIVIDQTHLVRDGSFTPRHHKVIRERLYKTAEEIDLYWWHQGYMLTHKSRNTFTALSEFKYAAWVKATFATIEEIEEIDTRLQEIKALTFTETVAMTIEVY